MKSFILDTCALLYALQDDERAESIQSMIDSYQVSASVINFWEIAVKCAKGKLKMSVSLERLIDRCSQSLHSIVPISEAEIVFYQKLLKTQAHKDPFDLMLIAQCQHVGQVLLTSDAVLLKTFARHTKEIYTQTNQ